MQDFHSPEQSKIGTPSLKAYGRIWFDSTKDLIVPIADEVTDFIGGVRFLR